MEIVKEKSVQVIRNYPAGKNKDSKFTTEDDYESVYLRHRYLHKSPNPSTERNNIFIKAAEKNARKASNVFDYVFTVNGQNEEDLLSYAKIQIISYLGNFGLREHPEKLESFIKGFKSRKEKDFKRTAKSYTELDLLPTDLDIDKKDIDNYSSFVWQRLEEWAKVASVKNKNIRGTYSDTGYFKASDKINDSEIDDVSLLENPEHFGFKEITKKEFDLKRKTTDSKKNTRFIFENHIYRKAYISPVDLTETDLGATIYGDDKSPFYSSPQDNLIRFSTGDDDEISLMDNISQPAKLLMMKNFVEKNKKNAKMTCEVEAAIDYIRKIEVGFAAEFEEYGVGAYSRFPRR